LSGKSYITDPQLTVILFSILVKRLGGAVQIYQSDIDDIAFNRLEEFELRRPGTPDRGIGIEFKLIERKAAS
jgi:hypothetical protein